MSFDTCLPLCNCQMIHHSKKVPSRTSLVVQWLRIHLPMQETQVQSLLQESSSCLGKTKPMCHNYWASMFLNKKSPRTPTREQPGLRPLEKASVQQQRPSAAKNNFLKRPVIHLFYSLFLLLILG